MTRLDVKADARQEPVQTPPRVGFTLPVRSRELLSNPSSLSTLALEKRFGNGDLIEVLDILGIAGPFRVESPWELRDADGRHLIHAGGYAAVPFGESYPPLMEALEAFTKHNTQLGFSQQSASEWRAALATDLVALLAHFAPSHADSRVFFSNSGAEAIETALKFARVARPKADTFVNFGRAYHGKTLGALALTPNEEYQSPFRPLAQKVITVPYGDLNALDDALRRAGGSVAAVFVEPIQGEAGVIIPPSGFLSGLGDVAQKHHALVVADEIQTGLGRTGSYFASLDAGLEPDIVTLAKPLGGGILPIGATIARLDIYRAMLGGLESKRHSNTFGGGSLAMAVGLRSLEILVDEDLVRYAREAGDYGLERLRAIQAAHPGFLSDVRGAGMLFGMTVQPVLGSRLPGLDEDTIHLLGAALALRALHQGGVHACYSITANRTVRLTPPLNLPRPLLEQLFDRVEATAARNHRAWTMLPKFPLGRLTRLARMAL